MIKLPTNGQWSQSNNSDKFSSLFATKNMNLDEDGYIKLSPRTVAFFNDVATVYGVGDTSFNFPVAFGRTDAGIMYIATTDEPFNLSVSNTSKSITQDSASNNPNLTFDSHGVWWQNRFYESGSTTVSYNAGGTWTADAITDLTSGKRHTMEVFKNRDTLCVSNGNVLKQYYTDHSASTDLTLPTDFEIIGLAYNNYRMGIITRLGSSSSGQNAECFFFSWDGATTEANQGVSLGSYTSFAITPYKSSFAIINSLGQLLYWNGGGFEMLASFPIYYSSKNWGNLVNFLSYGDNMVVDGDVIYINVGFDIDASGNKQAVQMVNNPSGVWCYDPKIGLYHKWSPSNSNTYFHNITSANLDTSTDTITTSITIPKTGNPLMLSEGTVGGLITGQVYFVIKVSDTTFKVAETKEKALAGDYINLTSASANNYFWLYDIVDYGISYSDKSGAVAIWGSNRFTYTDVIFGGRYYDSALDTLVGLCSVVPFLENRGYFITPKVFSSTEKDIYQKLYIKYRPLGVNDKIIVKVKRGNFIDLPISAPQMNRTIGITWTSPNGCYTSVDLSAAKTVFDLGRELEIEFTAGIGAGQMVKITNISYDGTNYALELEEDVVGATSGTESYFIIDNWEKLSEANDSNQDESGIIEMPITGSSKWAQFKVEMRGFNTTIEDFTINNIEN